MHERLGDYYHVSCSHSHAGHSPGPECKFGMNRESYSLSSGLSLGMIGLAVRTSHPLYLIFSFS